MYYGRVRHTINECYAKHGYPLGHPRYPGKPQYHNRAFGLVNNVATNKQPKNWWTWQEGKGYTWTKPQHHTKPNIKD